MSAEVWIRCDECGEQIDMAGSEGEARRQINAEESGHCSELGDFCPDHQPTEQEPGQ